MDKKEKFIKMRSIITRLLEKQEYLEKINNYVKKISRPVFLNGEKVTLYTIEVKSEETKKSIKPITMELSNIALCKILKEEILYTESRIKELKNKLKKYCQYWKSKL